MNRKTKKIVSGALAGVMAVSMVTTALPAFAAENDYVPHTSYAEQLAGYKANYPGRAVKQGYTNVIKAVDTELDSVAFNGWTIQEAYKVLPSMAGVAASLKTVDAYKTADPEIFADFTVEGDVTVEALDAFFKDHPVVVKDEADFTAKLKNFVAALVAPEIVSLIGTVAGMAPMLGLNMKQLGTDIDNLLGAFGITTSKGFQQAVFKSKDEKVVEAYLFEVLDAVLPGATGNVLEMVKAISFEENGAKLYSSLADVLKQVQKVLNSKMIGSLVGDSLKPIQDTVAQVADHFNKIPTVGEGAEKRFETEGTFDYLVNQVLYDALINSDPTIGAILGSLKDAGVKLIGFEDRDTMAILFMPQVNLENLKGAETQEDILNVLCHFFYRALNTEMSKAFLVGQDGILPMLPMFMPETQPIVDFVTYATEHSEEETFCELHKLVTGKELVYNMTPATPVEPQEPEGTDWLPIGPSTPVEPEVPEGTDWLPIGPSTPVEPEEPTSKVTYTATYGEKNTKVRYQALLDLAEAEIEKGFTGNTVQEMWKLCPQIAGLLSNCKAFKTVDFYKNANPAIFGELTAEGEVTADVLTAYFKDHPVAVADSAAFTKELTTFVAAVLGDENVAGLLPVLVAFSVDMTATEEVQTEQMMAFTGAFDEFCKAFGIKQDKTFFEVAMNTDAQGDVAYVNNIINAVLPNVVDSLLLGVKDLGVDANAVHFYNFAQGFVPGLQRLVAMVGPMLGEDGTKLVDTVNTIAKAIINAPTKGTEDAKMFDLEAMIKSVNDVAGMPLIGFVGDTEIGAINLIHINPANLAEAKDSADIFNVIFHWAIESFHANTGEEGALNPDSSSSLLPLLDMLPDMLPSLIEGITPEQVAQVKDLIKQVKDVCGFVANHTEEEIFYELYVQLTGIDMGELVPGMAELFPAMEELFPAMAELIPGMAELQPGMAELQPSEQLEPGEEIDGSWVNMTPAMVDYTGNPATPVEEDTTKPATTEEDTNKDKKDDVVDMPNTGATAAKSAASAVGLGALALGIYEIIKRKRNK